MRKPFIVGPVATGRKFIGRKEYLSKIKEFTKYGNAGCMSVCGLPRIGKTSIVKKAFKFSSKKILSVFVDLAAMTTFYDLWKTIVKELFDQLEKLGVSFYFETIKTKIEDACNNSIYEELRECLIDFFRELSKEKYKCVIAIDEFDYIARGVFGNDQQCGVYLNCLREIFSQRPDIRASLIVISRRDIASLESRYAYGSTFHGVCQVIAVFGFSDNDYNEYLDILKGNKVNLGAKTLKDIETYGGRSPFLLAQIGNYLCENAEKQDIKEFVRNRGMIKYYNDLVKILNDEEYFDSMIKIFVGPKYDLKPHDVNTLENLGYIYYIKDGDNFKVMSLSKDFTSYLHELIMLDENRVIWPKLNQVELHLRQIIEKVLIKKFGTSWENDIRSIYKTKFAYHNGYRNFIRLDKADDYIDTVKRKYKGKTYMLLKVLSVWELRNLITYFWQDGISAYFSWCSQNELVKKLDLLQRVRDPLAHTNPEYLEDYEIRDAGIYCDEIITKSSL